MDIKCKFLNELKKYSKTVGLVLALGGVIGAAWGQTYNPTKAVQYANTWAAGGNQGHGCAFDGNSANYNNSNKSKYCGTSYYHKKCKKTNYGNDCVNFVWQCITGNDAGGLDWGLLTECNNLHKKLISFLGELNSNNYAVCTSISGAGPSFVPSWLAPGDVVIWWNNGVNTTKGSGTNHAAIVVSGNGSSALLNAHTSNRYSRNFGFFGTGSSWSAISYYHLSGLSSSNPIISNERPILSHHIDHTLPSDFYNYPHLIHSGGYNGEIVRISVSNAITSIPVANLKIKVKGIIGEPAYSYDGSYGGDQQAYSGSTRLLFEAEHDNFNLNGNQWFWQPVNSVAWDGKWVKIIAINTRGIANDSNCLDYWDTAWRASEPIYIKVVSSSIGINDIKPQITTINGQTISNMHDVKQVQFSNNIPFVIDGKGYVGGNSLGDYEEYMVFHYAILANIPAYTNNPETATINQSSGQPNHYLGGEYNHDGSVANKYYLHPENAKEWTNRYVKIIPYNAAFGIWGEPRYIYIMPSNKTLPNDNFYTATNTPNPKPPSISTTPSQYTNCYREGSTVYLKVTNVNANDIVELHWAQIKYEKRNVDCSYSNSDCIYKPSVPLYCTVSSNFTISFTLQQLQTTQNWAGTTLKIKVKSNGKWSNDIYIDVRKKDNADISYLTACDYKEAFDNTNSFNWRFAYWCGKAAEASYGNGNTAMQDMDFTIINSSNNIFNDAYNFINAIKYDIGEKTINGQKYIMISIRGTVPFNNNWVAFINNAFTDISAFPRKWLTNPFEVFNPPILLAPYCNIYKFTAEAHGGFFRLCQGIWNQQWNNYFKKNMDAKYVVTGHSMGGAVAELISLKLADNGIPASNILCYGFASPPVGDLDLVNHAEKKNMRNRIHKLLNDVDAIPFAGLCSYTLAESVEPFNDPAGHSMLNAYLKHLKTEAAKIDAQ